MILAELIKACQQNDLKAKKVLYKQFAPKVLTICRRYAANDQDAEDYFQECFIHLFSQIEKYDISRGAFGAWLYRICTNKILQAIRSSKKMVDIVYSESLPEPGISEEEIEYIPLEVILKAIQQLPEANRLVLNLYIFEKWSHQEIAEELGINASSSRSRLTRAKTMLKTILKKTDYIEDEKRLVRRKII